MEKKLLIARQLISVILLPFILSKAHAAPPKEIIKSCHQRQAVKPEIKLIELDGMFDYKEIQGCGYRQRYTVKTGKYYFYTEGCDDGQYFVAGNRKIKFENSVNKSSVVEIVPRRLTTVASWYKIQFKNKSYICMESALGENGWAAAVSQYYFVENAFDNNSPLQVYFYFFDKKFIDKVRNRGWTNG
jgi:hypothetical protein